MLIDGFASVINGEVALLVRETGPVIRAKQDGGERGRLAAIACSSGRGLSNEQITVDDAMTAEAASYSLATRPRPTQPQR